MSGRGDNNKSGTSGQGAANQSNQGFGQTADRGKSYSGDRTGGKPSEPDKKTKDGSGSRDTGSRKKG